jgi:hypothetical protein
MSLPAITLWANSNRNEFAADWQNNGTISALQFKQGDTVGIELHWVEHQAGAPMSEVLWPPAANITLAIGLLDAAPTSGHFRLAYDSLSTGDIEYNATAATIQTALNSLAGIAAEGGVSVIKNGTTIRISWNDPAVVSSTITVSENNLTPTSSIGIGVARVGSSMVSHVVQLHIKQTPVAVCSEWVDSPTPTVTLTEIHAPAYSGDFRIWRMVIDPEPRAGTFRLSKVINGTLYWAPPVNINGLSDTTIASALGLNVARISDFEFEISQPQIALDVTVNVSLLGADSSGLIPFSSKYGVLNLNSLDVELLLGGAASKACVCEIEVELNGKYQTLVQSTCTVYNDLIDTDAYTLVEWGEVIPADSVVRYDTSQTLTSGQQAQARLNIGAIGQTNLTALTTKDNELEARVAAMEGVSLDQPIVDALQGAASPSATNVFATSDEMALKADVGHTHAIGDVTGLTAALGGKSNTTHTHAITDVTDLSALLDDLALSKADIVHVHNIADVQLLDTALSNKANVVHTHPISEIDNLQLELDLRPPLDPAVTLNFGGFSNGGFNTVHYPKEIRITIDGILYAMPARIV